jgi:hypothetical protein
MYDRIFRPIVSRSESLLEEFLQPIIHMPRHPLTAVRFGVLALLSARQLVRSHFLRETAGALFAGLAAHSFLPLSSAGSAAFWQANNIVGLTRNDTVTVKFSAPTLNPSMTVSEYTSAPPPPSGGGGGTGGGAIQPSIWPDPQKLDN